MIQHRPDTTVDETKRNRMCTFFGTKHLIASVYWRNCTICLYIAAVNGRTHTAFTFSTLTAGDSNVTRKRR